MRPAARAGGGRVLRHFLIIAVMLAAPFAQPARAADDISAKLAALQMRDERVQSIGWNLVTGNAPFCAETRPAAGLLLQDVAAFGDPAAARAAMGLSGDIAVQARATGSPADRAGLPVFAEVLSVDGQSMHSLPPAGPENWQRLAALHRKLDEALRARGQVEIVWRDRSATPISATLVGQTACASGFEVIAGSRRASANGDRVAVGADFVGFTYAEELLAAAIAHELAHNLLGHPGWLDEIGRKRRTVRVTEREADRLMPWLLANGGYDPAAALRFMRTWGPGNDGGLFRSRTHDGWDERAEFIAAELPLIARSRAASGAADWRTGFRREIDPAPIPAPAYSAPSAVSAGASSGSPKE
ncbi:hypothetical protein [Allopontixanthobacter sp.]|uniref:hypothetical protein n=1 Tax=Allopontixanthobacter sp. TaxID=2906452 RepID=UPI002ABBA31D|nr:hypothetical protein [Allopontixanthobacter sp.]MDZ4308648.1 hypothetical protein [Allopontixanthobacter sp.]